MSRVVAAVGGAANAASKYTLASTLVARHLIVCICILLSILYVLEYKWRAPRNRACMLLIIYYDSYVTYSRWRGLHLTRTDGHGSYPFRPSLPMSPTGAKSSSNRPPPPPYNPHIYVSSSSRDYPVPPPTPVLSAPRGKVASRP